MLRHCAMVVCVTTVFLSAIGTAPAVSYYFQDLGAIGGDTSFGYGISPAGEVVGITGTGGTSSQAVCLQQWDDEPLGPRPVF